MGYTAQQMLSTHRGGGLYSAAVSQRAGSVIAASAGNARIHPSILTLGSLSVGVASSALGAVAGVRGSWLLGVVALVGWQVAYALDCADGQLARVANQTSPYGARVDVLVDFGVQVSVAAAVVTVVDHYQHPHPAVLSAYATLWVVSLFTSVLASGAGATSLITSSSAVVQLLKLTRDYGFVILVLGVLVTVAPRYTVGFLAFYLAFNALFLLASIGRAAQLSMRAG